MDSEDLGLLACFKNTVRSEEEKCFDYYFLLTPLSIIFWESVSWEQMRNFWLCLQPLVLLPGRVGSAAEWLAVKQAEEQRQII